MRRSSSRWGKLAAAMATALVVGTIGAPAAAADPPHGPAWPPPGGAELASSGNAGRAGGATWSFTAIDREAFTSLWWGPAGGGAVALATDGTIDAPGETMTFDAAGSDLAGGLARFGGTSTLHFFQSGGWRAATVPSRFTLTIPGGTLIDPASVEIDPGAGGVHAVEGDFSANFLFEVNWSGSWQPVLDLYDSLNTDPTLSVRSSFSAGFFWPNRGPVADALQVATDEDTPLDLTLTGTDPDGDAIAFVVDAPAHGVLSGEAPNLTYTPDADFNGSDSFTFTVSDGTLVSEPATIEITVAPVNDAPVASDLSVTTDEDAAVATPLSVTDVDGDELTYQVVSGPTTGTLSGEAPALTYTPNADFNGSDSFTFTASDGVLTSNQATVAITIAAVNDAPRLGDDTASVKQYDVAVIDVLANDTDVEGEPLTIDAVSTPGHGTATIDPEGTITYRPDVTFKDSDSFTYTVSDGNGGVSTATVTVLELGCGEDGPVSQPVDEVAEPAVGSLDPYLAAGIHDANCTTVVPLEDQLPLP